ncbi:hypothetical protein Gotur_020921, partial [Gossypium turneri]
CKIWISFGFDYRNIIWRITSIPPLHPSAGSDKIAWMGTSSSCLSVKSAYRMVKESSWNPSDASCLICGHELEDVLHAIRDCDAAKEVWSQIIPPQKQEYFFLVSLCSWRRFYEASLEGKDGGNRKVDSYKI